MRHTRFSALRSRHDFARSVGFFVGRLANFKTNEPVFLRRRAAVRSVSTRTTLRSANTPVSTSVTAVLKIMARNNDGDTKNHGGEAFTENILAARFRPVVLIQKPRRLALTRPRGDVTWYDVGLTRFRYHVWRSRFDVVDRRSESNLVTDFRFFIPPSPERRRRFKANHGHS